MATMVELYGYKKCTTTKKVETYLKNKNIAYTFIDILEKPPSKSLLQTIIKELQIEPKKLVNNCSPAYRELQLKDKISAMTKEEILSVLQEHPKLFKRPIVVDKENKRYSIGADAMKVF